jgi:glycosyltransferase involved in cell wall biosynthesis
MPVKNGMPFLPEAVDSVLRQTFGEFQFLIIDDGSTDETPRYIESLGDPRVRVVRHETSQGVARSLNEGLALCTTPFIARQDADDISEPERLERQMRFMTEHPECIVLGTQGHKVDEAGNDLEPYAHRPSDENELRSLLLLSPPFIHGSVLMRREPVLRAGGYRDKIRFAEDYDLWLRLEAPHALANLPEVLYRYRVHGSQICTAFQSDATLDCLLCRVLHTERLCTRDEDSLTELQSSDIEAIKLRSMWRPRGSWRRRVRVLWHYGKLLESDSPRRAMAAKFLAWTGGW